MSTVKLLKDDGKDKAGAEVSRPYVVAKKLIAAGIAEYKQEPAPKPVKPVEQTVPLEIFNKLVDDHKAALKVMDELEAKCDGLDIENKKLAAALEAEKAKHAKK